MKICFFSGDISRTGGTERVTTVLASELARRGYSVYILSMSHGMKAGFPVHPSIQLTSLHMQGRSANFSDFSRWRALRRFVREEKVDLLVDVDVVLSWYSLPATLGLGTKVVSWEHFHRLINVGDLGQRLRRRMGRWLAVRRAACVVTLTTRDRNQYLAHERCHVPVLAIPNPVTILPTAHADLDAKVVLAAGRLVPQKGFDLLLTAWAQVALDFPGWKLRIAGSGPDKEGLVALAGELAIEGSISFVSHSSDMDSEYRAATLYAMSSRFEGLPLALIEAKAFGLPIVSFDCACGPSDIVRDGVDGLLVPAGDVNALGAALASLMKDADRRRSFGAAAAQDSRFALDQITMTWMKLIEDLGRN